MSDSELRGSRLSICVRVMFVGPGAAKVDFAKDVCHPPKNCVGCHGPRNKASGFRLDRKTR